MNECCLKMPIALLTTVLDENGVLTGIENVSEYNDNMFGLHANRRAEWYIFKNNRIVYAFGMDYLPIRLSIGGNRGLMQLPNGATTVFDFLAANNIPYLNSDIIEIAIKVINGKKYQSGLSNRILISASSPTNCHGYKLKIGGMLYGAVDYSGNCYIPQ